MRYNSWEDMVDAQAIAFSALCAQNARLSELADKADDGYNFLSDAEQEELEMLMEQVNSNPFFARRCELETEAIEEEENSSVVDDPLEQESYVDLFGPWWE